MRIFSGKTSIMTPGEHGTCRFLQGSTYEPSETIRMQWKICRQLRDIADLLQQLPSLETKSISIKTEPGEDRYPLLDWEMGRDSQRQRQHRLLTIPRGTYQFEPQVVST